MSVFDFDVSESLAFYDNDVQGNKFNGLEFDDVLTEGLFLEESFLLSSFEILDEFLDLGESFSNEHHCIVTSILSLVDSYIPSAALQLSAVQIAHRKKVSPVDIYWVSMDIVHGPDVFYEELGETFFLYSGTIIANMFFEPIFDSFFMDMDPPYQTFVDVARVMFMKATDLYVLQHAITPEYRLNNLCDDPLFVFCLPIRAFPHLACDGFRLRDSIVFAHARAVDEALAWVGACGHSWLGYLTLEEVFSSIDSAEQERFYDMLLAESIAFTIANDGYAELNNIATSDLGFADFSGVFASKYVTLMESLAASGVASIIYSIEEQLDASVSFDINTITGQIVRDLIQDTVQSIDDPDFYAKCLVGVVDSLVSFDVASEES